jgi:uncharacterized protein YacL
MTVKLFRWIYALIGIAAGYAIHQILNGFIQIPQDGSVFGLAPVLFVALLGVLGFLLTPMFVKRGRVYTKKLESILIKIPSERIAQYAAGLLIGVVIAFLISPIFSAINNDFLRVGSTVLDYITTIYFGIIISRRIHMSRSNLSVATRNSIMGKPDTEPKRIHPKILDASAILDGRIAQIIASGFLDGDVVIPEFVLVELRHTADSADDTERSRGRQGLDILNALRAGHGIEIYDTNLEPALGGIKDSETKLLKLAQKLGGKIVTDDADLVKMAALSGIDVLNVSSLTHVLTENISAGKRLSVDLMKEGRKDGQAIAYLADGSMVVVEDGCGYIGGVTDVTISRVNNSSNGRMIFARISGGASGRSDTRDYHNTGDKKLGS